MEKIKLSTLDKLIKDFKKFRPAATEDNTVFIDAVGNFIMTNKLNLNVIYGTAIIKHPIMDIIPEGKYLEVPFGEIKRIQSVGKTLLADVIKEDDKVKVVVEGIDELEFRFVEKNGTDCDLLNSLLKSLAVIKSCSDYKLYEHEFDETFMNLLNGSKYGFTVKIGDYPVVLHKKLFTTSIAKYKAGDVIKAEVHKSKIDNTILVYFTFEEKTCTSVIPVINLDIRPDSSR